MLASIKFDAEAFAQLQGKVLEAPGALTECRSKVSADLLSQGEELVDASTKLLNDLPDPAMHAAKFLKKMAQKVSGGEKLAKLQVSLEEIRDQLDDNVEGYLKLDETILQIKSTIANYALIALVTSPSISAPGPAGDSFRSDLSAVLETAGGELDLCPDFKDKALAMFAGVWRGGCWRWHAIGQEAPQGRLIASWNNLVAVQK